MKRSPSPWALFILGSDHPWVRPTCYRAYQDLDSEAQAQFRIGLSDRGAEYLSGAPIREADAPPPGTVCRCCWRTE